MEISLLSLVCAEKLDKEFCGDAIFAKIRTKFNNAIGNAKKVIKVIKNVIHLKKNIYYYYYFIGTLPKENCFLADQFASSSSSVRSPSTN